MSRHRDPIPVCEIQDRSVVMVIYNVTRTSPPGVGIHRLSKISCDYETGQLVTQTEALGMFVY